MKFLISILVAALCITPATAQELGDFGVGHMEWHHWYQTGENGGPLKMPTNPNVDCCKDDCRPTKARFVNGHWEVWADRKWEFVPTNAIKENVRTPNGMAHLCASKRYTPNASITIFCFVKPDTDG